MLTTYIIADVVKREKVRNIIFIEEGIPRNVSSLVASFPTVSLSLQLNLPYNI